MTEQRRLAAIVSADVAGYSRLMGQDESGTLAALKAIRLEVVDPAIATHGGRIVKTTGDGLLLEFPSVVNAVRCAVEVQAAMADRTAEIPEDRRIAFRIGINLGDIIVEGDDIFGDGVNVAARLQEIAAPGGICISSRVHEDVRDRLDTAFDDGGTQALKNIARPVQVWRWQPGTMAPPKLALALPSVAEHDRPPLSIVVLPFVNLAGDAEHDPFADGLTEDVTTDLSRLSGSFVIARNTAFTYKGRQVDAKKVGQELGIRYVLEGSVRRSSATIRANIQLIDAISGAHVWAERLDRDGADLLGLQDEITARIANALRVELLRSAARDAERRGGHAAEALDLLLRARSLRQKPSAIQTLGEAKQLFERALALDAGLVDGWAGLAYITSALALNFPDHNREAHLSIAEEAARQALALDPHHAESHFALGRVRLTQGRLEEAATEFEEAINLDRNHASAHTQLGLARMFQGRAEDTISLCLRAMRLSPRDPLYGNWQMFTGIAHLQLSLDQEAKSWLQRAVVNNPRYYLSRAWLAAAQWLTGDETSARDSIATTFSLNPEFHFSNSTGGIALTEAAPEFLRSMSRIHSAWHAMGVRE